MGHLHILVFHHKDLQMTQNDILAIKVMTSKGPLFSLMVLEPQIFRHPVFSCSSMNSIRDTCQKSVKLHVFYMNIREVLHIFDR